MNRLILASLSAYALVMPLASRAQQMPTAVVAVIDRERIAGECTRCVAATAQIRAQVQVQTARLDQLRTALDTESVAITAAVNALPQGTQPGAALRTRIETLRTNSQAVVRETEQARLLLMRNQVFLRDQIEAQMDPLIRQVMRERGVNLVVHSNATMASDPALNVTGSVLALMNQNATPFNVVAPPPSDTQPNPSFP